MLRLLHPFMYLRIRHKSKWRYDLLYPTLIAAAVGSVILFGPIDLNLSGERGLLDQANDLIGILVGFFIAALAAVATFDRPSMDEPMAGIPPTLRIVERKIAYEVPLSRRVYLSQLFGYLTVVSIISYAIGSVAQVVSYDQEMFQAIGGYELLRAVFVYGYCLIVSNIVVNTLLGVFYLSYRIHDLGSKRV